MRLFLLIVLLATLTMSGCSQVASNVKLDPNSFVFLGKLSKVASGVEVRSMASGFVVGSRNGDSYAMTAGHFCLNDPGEVTLKLTAIVVSGQHYEAAVVRAHKLPDICFVKIVGLIAPSVTLAREPPKYGDRVFSMSAPYGLFNKGMLPKLEGFYSGHSTTTNLDAHTLPSRPGSSGSPVFNESNKLIGMIVMAFGPLENIGFGVEYAIVRNHIISFRREFSLRGR
jgi:S1-C subfamily serine protease